MECTREHQCRPTPVGFALGRVKIGPGAKPAKIPKSYCPWQIDWDCPNCNPTRPLSSDVASKHQSGCPFPSSSAVDFPLSASILERREKGDGISSRCRLGLSGSGGRSSSTTDQLRAMKRHRGTPPWLEDWRRPRPITEPILPRNLLGAAKNR